MKKFLISLLIFAITLPVFAKNTILIIGDSVSAGYGVETGKGWAALLKNRLQRAGGNYDVVNASISGDTTSNGLSRLPKALADHSPKITIIELGGNDGLRGIQIDTIKSNLMQMISLAKKTGSKVVILGVRLPPNYGPAYTDQFRQIFTTLSQDKTLQVVPLFLQNVDDKPQLMQTDGIHPTRQAQPILLDNVWVALKPLLK
ncbi:MAG: arylesterase [Gammaproteobacteria bacterium]|nr:arylesterase [Gammaproteobacteria bacterium]